MVSFLSKYIYKVILSKYMLNGIMIFDLTWLEPTISYVLTKDTLSSASKTSSSKFKFMITILENKHEDTLDNWKILGFLAWGG